MGDYSFPYFINGNLFIKRDLINRINNIPEAKKYLADAVRIQSLTREFLIDVSK